MKWAIWFVYNLTLKVLCKSSEVEKLYLLTYLRPQEQVVKCQIQATFQPSPWSLRTVSSTSNFGLSGMLQCMNHPLKPFVVVLSAKIWCTLFQWVSVAQKLFLEIFQRNKDSWQRHGNLCRRLFAGHRLTPKCCWQSIVTTSLRTAKKDDNCQ